MSKDGDLVYVGPGYLNGIPADDLSPASIAALAETRGVKPVSFRASLLASGLYAEAKSKKGTRPRARRSAAITIGNEIGALREE